MPLLPVLGYIFQVPISRQDRCRRFHAPPRDARITVSTVTDHGQIIWDGFRFHSEFLDNASFITQHIAPPVELDDSGTTYALGEVLVWGTDEHSLDSLVLCCSVSSGGECVIRFEFNHRPNEHTHRL